MSDDNYRPLSDDEMADFFSGFIELIDIPEALYSAETEEPFRNCIKCKCDLFDDVEYSISKHFEEGVDGKAQIFLEYALCKKCHEGLGIKTSEESLKNIEALYDEVLGKELHNSTFSIFPEEEDLPEYLDHCYITCQKIDKTKAYSVIGQFKGDKLMMPSVMSFSVEARMKIAEVLSQETKEEMDKMYDIIDLPPSVGKAINVSDLLGIV